MLVEGDSSNEFAQTILEDVVNVLASSPMEDVFTHNSDGNDCVHTIPTIHSASAS